MGLVQGRARLTRWSVGSDLAAVSAPGPILASGAGPSETNNPAARPGTSAAAQPARHRPASVGRSDTGRMWWAAIVDVSGAAALDFAKAEPGATPKATATTRIARNQIHRTRPRQVCADRPARRLARIMSVRTRAPQS